ncbi:hypothetical protein ACWDV7_28575 [Streptomyces sp. NPDC003362]
MTAQAKALMGTGIGLCVLGAVGLVVGAVVDVEGADPWASVAGGVAGLLGLAVTIFALTRGESASDGASGSGAPPRIDVSASGPGAVAAGRDIGFVSTGGGNIAAPPSPPAPAAPAPGEPSARNVTASGDRSIAAGRDIHQAQTGDGPTA